jgi:hypothetical protein
MARPTHTEVEEIAQLRKEGDLGSYIRQLGGMNAKPRPSYLSVQCPHCGAPQNQLCTGLRGMMLSAGVHESRIRAVSPNQQSTDTPTGAWPVGLPMERKKEQEVGMSSEQAIRAAALQAAAVLVASMSGSEADVITLAEDFAAYIRRGPGGLQMDVPSEPPGDVWSESDRSAEAQTFATRGYEAATKEQFGQVWREAYEAKLMSVKVSLGNDTVQELGGYLTALSARFKEESKKPVLSDRTTRNDLGL